MVRLLTFTVVLLLISCGKDKTANKKSGDEEKLQNSVVDTLHTTPSQLSQLHKDIIIETALEYEDIIYTSTFNNEPSVMRSVVVNAGSESHKVTFQYWLDDGFSQVVSITRVIPPKNRVVIEPGKEFNLANKAFAIKNETQTTLQTRFFGLDGKEVPLFERSYKIKILPPQFFNWQKPEHITAFITYQMDSIPTLQREVAQKIGSIDAYQSRDESRVEAHIRAAYETIAERQWHYIGGFSANTGQKIRYPVEVMRERSANCIEGTLLFSAILESMGIRTAIVLVKRPHGGHAYLAWKSDDRFDYFDKIVETTMAFGQGNSASYEQAAKQGGDDYYGDKNAGYITNIIDVKKMWNFGISLNEVP